MKKILFIVLLFCSTQAFATGLFGGANASANAVSRATQHQGQVQAQGQNQYGGNQTFAVGGADFKHQAPSFGLASMFPTAVCQGTLAAGFSFIFGGGAGAGTITIEECMKIETIRVGTYMLQNAPTDIDRELMHQSNLDVYCKLKHAQGTSACPQTIDSVAKEGEETETKQAKFGDLFNFLR